MGPLRSYLNERAIHFADFSLKPKQIADIIQLIDENKISNSAAAQRLFPELADHPAEGVEALAAKMDLIQNSNSDELQAMVSAVIAKFPEKVAEFKGGKVGLLGMFVGEVMKASKGKADPKLLNTLVREALEQ